MWDRSRTTVRGNLAVALCGVALIALGAAYVLQAVTDASDGAHTPVGQAVWRAGGMGVEPVGEGPRPLRPGGGARGAGDFPLGGGGAEQRHLVVRGHGRGFGQRLGILALPPHRDRRLDPLLGGRPELRAGLPGAARGGGPATLAGGARLPGGL